jgi:hypothetical protein
MRQLLERLLEKEVYAELEDMPLKKQALVTLLVEIQKKMEDLKARIEEYKGRRGKIEPDILKALHKLEANGVRLGKVLVFITQGRGFASFKEVMEVVQKEISPKVAKLLKATYDELSKEKTRGEELRVKLGRESLLDEDWKDVWQNIVNFFAKVFNPLLDSISGSIEDVEKLLGIK